MGQFHLGQVWAKCDLCQFFVFFRFWPFSEVVLLCCCVVVVVVVVECVFVRFASLSVMTSGTPSNIGQLCRTLDAESEQLHPLAFCEQLKSLHQLVFPDRPSMWGFREHPRQQKEQLPTTCLSDLIPSISAQHCFLKCFAMQCEKCHTRIWEPTSSLTPWV